MILLYGAPTKSPLRHTWFPFLLHGLECPRDPFRGLCLLEIAKKSPSPFSVWGGCGEGVSSVLPQGHRCGCVTLFRLQPLLPKVGALSLEGGGHALRITYKVTHTLFAIQEHWYTFYNGTAKGSMLLIPSAFVRTNTEYCPIFQIHRHVLALLQFFAGASHCHSCIILMQENWPVGFFLKKKKKHMSHSKKIL